MDNIEDFADERQKTSCIHCGRVLAGLECNCDHVPSRTILLKPYPENLPCIEICKACNEGFSLDEEYMIALLGCVLAGSTDPERQSVPAASQILRRKPALRQRIERLKTEYSTRGGEKRYVWAPETERIARIVLKNARGHALFEYGEPMLKDPERIWSAALETLSLQQRDDFERVETSEFWPEVGSRMLTRAVTGQDLSNGWVIVQDGVYRYSVVQEGVMRVRSVLFEYLATEVWWAE